MALIDYKIVRFSHDKRHVSVTVRLYRGAVEDVLQVTPENPNGSLVSTYVRKAKVAERTFEYDVPTNMSKQEFLTKARSFLNKKLNDFANTNGHTVITPQQDVSAYEAPLNEREL